MSNLEQAIEAIKSGDKAHGRKLLIQTVKEEPKNGQAWFWLSITLDQLDRKEYCLRQALNINPSNVTAQMALAEISSPIVQKSKEESSTQKRNIQSSKIEEQRNTIITLVIGLLGTLLICMASIALIALLSHNSFNSTLTKKGVLDARRQFEVEVVRFDASQEFGTTFPYADYVRLRITNNSDLTLPYLTVLTKRYDSSGKMIGSSRAPSIDVAFLAPGESAEYDYYPKGHLPSVKNITVEIEQLVDNESLQFFKEFENLP